MNPSDVYSAAIGLGYRLTEALLGEAHRLLADVQPPTLIGLDLRLEQGNRFFSRPHVSISP